MDDENLILQVRFYRTTLGNEPVRDWLNELTANDLNMNNNPHIGSRFR